MDKENILFIDEVVNNEAVKELYKDNESFNELVKKTTLIKKQIEAQDVITDISRQLNELAMAKQNNK